MDSLPGRAAPHGRGAEGSPWHCLISALLCSSLPGVVVQGAGSSDAYVTSFLLQFSMDGVRWHDYREAFPDAQLEPKVCA